VNDVLVRDDPSTDTSPRDEVGILARVARPALCLGAGATVALALPPWGFWPLAIVGVVVFDVALGATPSRRERFLLGWMFGAGWMFLGMGWMIQLTAPGYVAASAIFASYHALAALVAPVGAWRVIGRPAAHTLAEALRFSFPFGGVPLASMGIAQVAGPFAGLARVGGVILITWVIFQIGHALAGPRPTISAVGPRLRFGASGARQGAIALAVVVAFVALAAVAPTSSPTGETLRVAAVQGGGDQGTSALDVPSSLVTERHLEATRSIDSDSEVDLVLWPENAIDLVRFAGSDVEASIVAEAQRLGAPIAVGLTEDAEEGRFTNAQVVVTPEGEIVSRYDKVRRVPFGEYVPMRSLLELVSSDVDRIGEAVAGAGPAVLEIPRADGSTTPVGVVISWEVFFGGRAREGVREGGEAILNPTNGASYTGTILQTQQVASSRLRAIETSRWLVQAAPTGFTAFVDADGNVVDRSSQREQRVIIEEIELRTGLTWYTRLGDAPVILLVLAVFAASWILTIRRRRSAVTAPEAA